MPRKPSAAPGGKKQIAEAKANAAGQGLTLHKVNKPWWALDDAASAQVANQSIRQWLAFDTPRQNDLALFARLYGSAELQFAGTIQNRNLRTGAGSRIQNSLAATFNGIQSVTDTISNTVAQHKPVAQVAATDGDWTSHRIAKDRGRFIAGWFYEQEIYKKTAIQFRDSGVWGDGVIGVFDRCGRAVAERVFPGDLFVDPASCLTSNAPREMGRIHLMDRHTAWMMYEGNPEAQRKIEAAPEVKLNVDSLVSDNTDMIQLTEMWRLPSYEGAGDGWHLMATEDATLSKKQWKHPNFPFAIIQCIPRLFGFWSQGLAEQLENLQLQYNDTEYFINEALELGAGSAIFVDSSSNVVIDSLDNSAGRVMRGDGTPTSLLWNLIQPEIYEKQRERKAQFFEQSGVAQMVATQDKISPDESGIAIRQRVGVYDERHALWTQSYQDAHLTLARLAIQTISDIVDEEKADQAEDKPAEVYEVYSVNKPQSDPIDFESLRFEPGEQYVLTCMPVSDLPTTIEGRIAAANDMVLAGWYDQATAREVFGAPFDVARVETLFNASKDYYSKVLDAAVEKGTEPPPPDGNDNLPMGLQMALQQLAYAKVRDVSEARRDILTNYITALKAKILEAQPPPVPGPAPLGNPQAPPTSPLLPNPNAPTAAPPQ